MGEKFLTLASSVITSLGTVCILSSVILTASGMAMASVEFTHCSEGRCTRVHHGACAESNCAGADSACECATVACVCQNANL